MFETGWQPGILTVTIAALTTVVFIYGCMARFTIVQTNMVKIVFQPALCVGVTGIARTNIVVCGTLMAFFAISVSGMVEFKYLPILEVNMAVLTVTAVVVIFWFFGFVTG